VRRAPLRLLDRYVGREFVRIFGITVVGFPLFTIVVNLADNIDKYLSRGVLVRRIAAAYVFALPEQVFFIIPAAVLFATVFTLNALGRNSELTAVKAGGVSFFRLIAPMMVLVREQGLDGGPHLRLAFEVEKILLAGRWRLHMNYAALVASLAADFGLSPYEYYFFVIPAFLAGMPPCYLEAAEKPEGLLFPLPCRMLSYEGVGRRRWRDALLKPDVPG